MKAKTPAKKATKTTTKTTKKPVAKTVKKVDIYPNRMSLAVATLAAISLALFALMIVV